MFIDGKKEAYESRAIMECNIYFVINPMIKSFR